ncbi:hypothetical protein GUJ93_ZPchr0458g22329 [Zizania palustris]|uniref:SIT4 phosphatase-associated family protein n=1 Tax=Zizania palustris TaxID=103762 RepID=A0A8J5RD45_ZIZPA|nr:hypothetical protein GUJ93_ZPchr0458g22329 [Zizania palustris]
MAKLPWSSVEMNLEGFFGVSLKKEIGKDWTSVDRELQGHPEIVSQLVDLIGITSIMEVLIRLIGADETMYSSYVDSMQWLDDIQVLEMIADKFSLSAFRSQLSHGTLVTASPDTVNGMLDSLGDLLKLLDVSSADNVLPTTYGVLQPPLGKHRLKIVEFISVLLSIGSEAAEMRLIHLGAIMRVIDLFFEILEAEKYSALSTYLTKHTVPSEGRSPPRIGIVGHMTHISNKLIQLANTNSIIQSHLQQNSGWAEWHAATLTKRNAVENVYQWACGRPTTLQDRGRDSDDEDFRDRDYDVAALASNLSQAFKYGIYSNEDIDEAQVSLERDDEDVYFDDESAEVVISSLRLGDEHDSNSLFTNSNWFAFDENKALNDSPDNSEASPSPIQRCRLHQMWMMRLMKSFLMTIFTNGPTDKLEDDIRPPTPDVKESPPEFVEWREEEAEPADVPEDTTVSNGGVGSVDRMDAIDDASPATTELRDEKVSESTLEEILPGSPGVSSTRHPEPVDGNTILEPSVGEQKHEADEYQAK